MIIGNFLVRCKAWVSRSRSRRKRSHRWRQDATAKRLDTLRNIRGSTDGETFARRIAYLRKIDPLVFEEWVIDAFQRRGWTALRNLHYTGDGGLDGRIFKDGFWYGIQCKRYKGAIARSHVEQFAQDLRKFDLAGGFFVHTGRTPGSVIRNMDTVQVISGRELLDLLLTT
ncbi:restriction endonuclease [Acidithiobacillus sp. CV18-2]|nr:restriction endonuclease [Acidithiobacillus sp. CV18-3]MBU2756955.1 restriction endonuclease [Acidithiobacillus sp. BN09-2]MBU2777566.1 restriction endonuclease [Acidithiobacillus sp. CV18-2]MBU2799666.1 restriction endonuclease [Acidithiobacillus sp. VAN18-4]